MIVFQSYKLLYILEYFIHSISVLHLNQSEFSKSEEKNLSNFITYKVVRSPLIPFLASSDHLLPLEHDRVVMVASIAL